MFRNLFKPLALWCYLTVFLSTLGGLYVLPIFLIFSNDLPDYTQLKNYNPPSISRIYSYNGDKIAELSKERRIYEDIDDIPDLLIKAFLSAEDQNYFSHPGVDILSIGRAAIQNFANKGTDKNPVGGSTITQQVVKNFLLTNERTLSRKIKEAILAYRINKVYSKDKILELYLNQIYLGNGSYGVKAAAIDYFNKDLHQLDIAEAALLAALPKAPSHLDPFRHSQRAIERRNWVIQRMHDEGFITKSQSAEAIESKITLHPKASNSEYTQTYYSEAVRLEIIEKFGKDSLYEKGLTIHTNLVPKLQKLADSALQKGLLEYDKRHGYNGPIANYKFQKKEWIKTLKELDIFSAIDSWEHAIILTSNQHSVTIGLKSGKKGLINLKDLSWARKRLKDNYIGPKITSPNQVLKRGDLILASKKPKKTNEYLLQQVPAANGALVVIQPHTGKILALSGGFNFKLSNYNRAIQAKRQPGSTFKAFVYLSALEQGYSPLSVVKDEPLVISQGEGKPDWTPKNYSGNFMGAITMRTALEKSRNLATIRVLMAAGVENVANLSQRFGVYENPPLLLSMALGAYETTPLKIISAYASIASNGIKLQPSLINRINDINGKLIYSSDRRKCVGCTLEDNSTSLSSFAIPKLENNAERIINPQTNYQLISMLTGAVERGTGRRARVVGKTLAGKTGTSNKSNDTWFIGFSPDLVAGVYIGYDSPKTLGNYENGAVTALPVFATFMKAALKNIDDKSFPIPDGVEIIEIDKDTGQPVNIFTKASNKIRESLKSREIDSYKEILEEQIESRINEEIIDDTLYSTQSDDISGVY